jgi:hypothetical protein
MMSSTYDDGRKSTCIWKRVPYNILRRMLLNVYILYQQNTDTKIVYLSRIKFIQSIAQALSGDHVIMQHQRVNQGSKHRVAPMTR